jgi:hypothetical protein
MCIVYCVTITTCPQVETLKETHSDTALKSHKVFSSWIYLENKHWFPLFKCLYKQKMQQHAQREWPPLETKASCKRKNPKLSLSGSVGFRSADGNSRGRGGVKWECYCVWVTVKLVYSVHTMFLSRPLAPRWVGLVSDIPISLQRSYYAFRTVD